MSEKLSKTRSKVPGLKRVPSGIPGFDDMIGGGFLPGSIIIVAGGGGTGKTIFALQSFLSQKFSAGNRGSIISFEENPEEIKSICGSFGLKIPAAVKIMYFNPNTLNAKAILKTISSELKKGVRHILVNSATSIKMKDGGLESFLKEAVTLLKHAGAGAFICMHGAMRENLQGVPDVLIELSLKRDAENISRRITVLKSRSTVLKVSSSKIEFGAKGLAAGSFPDAAENADNIINTGITFDSLEIDGLLSENFKKTHPRLRLRFVKEDMESRGLLKTGEAIEGPQRREFKYDLIRESLYEIQRQAKEKLILPIGGYFNEITKHEFFRSAREVCSYNGDLYSLPGYIHPFGLTYRKDIFKKHGISIPATAGELVDTLKFILSREKSFKYGICFPGESSLRHCLYTRYLTGGPDLNMLSGKMFDLNSPEIEAALVFLRDCIYKHKIAPVPDMNADPFENIKKVINGEALSAEWWVYGFTSALMKTDRSLGEKIGFDTIPALHPGAKPVSMIYGQGYAIPATAKYPTKAAEVFKFITSYEQEKLISEKRSYIPVLTGRIDVWRELEKKIPHYMNAVKFMETAYLPDKRFHAAKYIDIVVDCCLNVLVKRMNIKEALAAANEKIKHWKRTSFYHKASEDAKKFMEQNYSRKINMNEIARSVNLSQHFFTRVFKENSGITVFDFLSEVRLNRAKKLLRENYRMNISEIASATGFSSAFHFSKVFKKREGTTPLDYRISG